MESRIILKRADFSQNNIGRYVELNALTKNILAKQTQYEESSSEAAALNTFVEYLIANNYIGGNSPKFRVLIIPALAKNHDEILFNIAAVDNNGYPTDMMASAEKIAETKIFIPVTDASSRIVGLSSRTPSSFANVADYKAAGAEVGFTDQGVVDSGGANYQDAPGRTIFLFSTKEISASDTLMSSYNLMCAIYTTYLGLSYQQTIVGYEASSTRGFLSVSYNNSINTFEATVSDGITLTERQEGTMPHNQGVSPSQSSPMRISKSFTPLLNIAPFGYSDSLHASWSILGVSDYISPSDLEDLKDKVEDLMTELHVEI